MQSLMYYLSALRPCTTCGGGVALCKHCTRDTASQVPPAAGAAVADRCPLVMLCGEPGHKMTVTLTAHGDATAFSRSRFDLAAAYTSLVQPRALIV
eukprot:8409-Heterococcus_DN1.PRE.4